MKKAFALIQHGTLAGLLAVSSAGCRDDGLAGPEAEYCGD
jgi:hypothetical protein